MVSISAAVAMAESPPIHIRVNGELRELPRPMTVAELLEHLDVRAEQIAVEQNHEVVVRARRGEVNVADGDVIEIVSFVGGG